MLQGLTTVNFFADDVPAAVQWYSELPGSSPTSSGRGGAGSVCGVPDRRRTPTSWASWMVSRRPPTAGPTGSVVYWHVDDVAEATERAMAPGATAHDPIVVREAGFVTGIGPRPFGNILGLMHSPHWIEVHGDGPTV